MGYNRVHCQNLLLHLLRRLAHDYCTTTRWFRRILRLLLRGLHWVALAGLLSLPALGLAPDGYGG